MGNAVCFKLGYKSCEPEGCVMLKMARVDLSSQSQGIRQRSHLLVDKSNRKEQILTAKVLIGAQRSWTTKFNSFAVEIFHSR